MNVNAGEVTVRELESRTVTVHQYCVPHASLPDGTDHEFLLPDKNPEEVQLAPDIDATSQIRNEYDIAPPPVDSPHARSDGVSESTRNPDRGYTSTMLGDAANAATVPDALLRPLADDPPSGPVPEPVCPAGNRSSRGTAPSGGSRSGPHPLPGSAPAATPAGTNDPNPRAEPINWAGVRKPRASTGRSTAAPADDATPAHTGPAHKPSNPGTAATATIPVRKRARHNPDDNSPDR